MIESEVRTDGNCSSLPVSEYRTRALPKAFPIQPLKSPSVRIDHIRSGSIELGSRKVVQVGVTRSPSQAWTAQQLRNATPWGTGPRFLGSVRRECLDHVLILSEQHLLVVLREYVAYFNEARPHQGINQRIPADPVNDNAAGKGTVIARPVLGGLHHDYRRVG